MRIGIDARLIGQTGVGVYISNLIREIGELNTEDIQFYLYVSSSRKFEIRNSKFEIREANHQWHSVSEQIGFYNQLMDDRLDLMHFTYFSYPTLYTRPFVSTIHDLTPLLFKTGRASTKNLVTYYTKHQAYSFLMRRAINNSSAIIVPTNSVKQEIIEYYGERFGGKIEVTYEGVNKLLIEAEENQSLKNQFTKPFFLYVGNFYPHKNVERLVEAFSKLDTDHELVLVGPSDYFARRLKVTAGVRFYHEPSLEDFVFFYKNASALVHPSLSEGFGLPIVEASYFRLPIIASNIAVFDELLGSEHLTFSPNDTDSITGAIKKFLDSPAHYHDQFIPREKLETTFSFTKMAKQTLEIYRKAKG